MTQRTFQLFSTPHCHLCEHAQSIITQVQNANDFTVHIIDIAEDDTLMQQYGQRIPVLACAETKLELNWPFDHGDVLALTKRF